MKTTFTNLEIFSNKLLRINQVVSFILSILSIYFNYFVQKITYFISKEIIFFQGFSAKTFFCFLRN
jgi:hypothetical protein